MPVSVTSKRIFAERASSLSTLVVRTDATRFVKELIGQIVRQRLLQRCLVAHQFRDLGDFADRQRQTLGAGGARRLRHDRINDFAGSVGALTRSGTSDPEPGQFKNGSDQGCHVLTGNDQCVETLGLFGAQWFALHEVGHALDMVEWCAHLVAHVGEERVFGDVRGFGLPGAYGQFVIEVAAFFERCTQFVIELLTRTQLGGQSALRPIAASSAHHAQGNGQASPDPR